MKIIVQMHNHKEEWFDESKKMLQRIFNKYNAIPTKGDCLACDNGEIHTVIKVQWMCDELVVWVEHDYRYIEARQRQKQRELNE